MSIYAYSVYDKYMNKGTDFTRDRDSYSSSAEPLDLLGCNAVWLG